jgi:lactate 2-monooxygenase
VSNFSDFQLQIYLQGLSGVRPKLPMTYDELERRAHATLDPELISYVAGGAGDGRTQDANVTAFDRWGLIPKMLVGASERDLSIELCGLSLPTPLLMAPIGVIGMCARPRRPGGRPGGRGDRSPHDRVDADGRSPRGRRAPLR